MATEKLLNKTGLEELVRQLKLDYTFQFSVVPAASEDYKNKIIQYTGTTDDYTTGSFYQCVETDTDTYDWVEILKESENNRVDTAFAIEEAELSNLLTGDIGKVFFVVDAADPAERLVTYDGTEITAYEGYFNKVVITTELYDNLPSAVKNEDIVWYVIDGGGAANDSAISTSKNYYKEGEEVLTNGIWVDGRPIYRYCKTDLNVSLPQEYWTQLENLQTLNPEKVIDATIFNSSGIIGFVQVNFTGDKYLQTYCHCGATTVNGFVVEYVKET